MLMGRSLLQDLGTSLVEIDHIRFDKARELIETKGEDYFSDAILRLQLAVSELYGNQPVSLQRLSATFRRGDLFQYLG